MLLSLTHGYKRYFALSIVASTVSVLFSFASPQIIRFTVDSVIGNEPLSSIGGIFEGVSLPLCALAIILCSLMNGLFSYASRVTITRGTEAFAKALRDRLFAHIQRLPYSWHTQNQTGDIIQRCTSDLETIRNFISAQLIEVLRTVILIVAAMALMFRIHLALALISLLFVPLIILYSTVFYGVISKQFQKADEAEGDLTAGIQENLTGVRVVRAFGREKYERERFEQKLDLFTKLWVDLGYIFGLYWGIGDMATGLQMLVMICAGAYFASTGQITLGEMLVFISYTQILQWPIRGLGRTLSELSKTVVSVSRVREILDTPSESGGGLTPDLSGDIRFDNVSFAYGEQTVLSNLSFAIEKGSTCGILGATGSGKSTITYLLNRLYELEKGCGSITIGGVDIREIDLEHLRRGVGLILQEPFLFSKTIGENISIAAEDSNRERIIWAADTAVVHDSIAEFREGYDTMVGERGVTLSGGQKQRVAIARTLLMDSPILVFDDSMSNLDMETDERIRKSLRENAGDATVILISHRINTLMEADKIIVLSGGRLSQIGTHQELINQSGIYRRVYQMQADAGGQQRGGIEN